MADGSKGVIYIATAANFCIALSKFIAAFLTASSAMIAEGIHSSVDTGNELLLLLGINLSKRAADKEHPFGHGHEVYFWTFIVAIVIFAIGGGMSIYEGITHLIAPSKLEDPFWNYIVLGIAFVFEGTSWVNAVITYRHKRKKQLNVIQAFRKSKDPTQFIVLFEDSVAILGLMVAFAGVFLGHQFNNPYFDGTASVIIGLMLALVSVFLSIETKGLLIGEGADPETVRAIKEIVESDNAVKSVIRVLTMQLGPEEILVNIDIEFKQVSAIEQLEMAIDRIENEIRVRISGVKYIFLEVESLKGSQSLHKN